MARAGERPIRFGTSGWRGVLGDEVTDERVRAVAHGIASALLAARGDARTRRVLLGFDGRFASARLAEVACAVLQERGLSVTSCPGVAPTPAVARAARGRHADGAVVLTASHNPAQHHGIKVFGARGEAVADEAAARIEAAAGGAPRRAPRRASAPGSRRRRDLVAPYRRALLGALEARGVRDARPRVVYDAMHGAGAGVLDAVLEAAGARVAPLRGEPDPTFGGAPPDPVPSRLADLARALRRGRGLRLGLATDGDGDRLAAVDERGRVLADGEWAALLLEHLAGAGRVRRGGALGPACSSRLEAIARAHGLAVMRRPVGFKHLAPLLLDGRADLAIDESGGFAQRGFSADKDGMRAGSLLVELVAQRGRGLGALLRELESRYGRRCARRAALPADGRVAAALRRLASTPPARVDGAAVEGVEAADGVRLALHDGFLMWRRSGTEPVVRVYAEGVGAAAAQRRLAAGARLLRRASR